MATSRQTWRRQSAEKDRQNRATTEFIKLKYPGIYLEAVNAYRVLREKYPNKYDVRKLPEFYQMCCVQLTDPNTKKSNETESNNPKNIVQNNTVSKQFQDRMILNIDLVKMASTQSTQSTSEDLGTQPTEIPTQSTSEDLGTQPMEIPTQSTSEDLGTQPMEIPTQSTSEDLGTQPMEIPTQSTSEDLGTQLKEIPTQSTSEDLGLELLDPSVIDNIIQELRQDCNLNNFFDDIELNEMSPLEEELLYH